MFHTLAFTVMLSVTVLPEIVKVSPLRLSEPFTALLVTRVIEPMMPPDKVLLETEKAAPLTANPDLPIMVLLETIAPPPTSIAGTRVTKGPVKIPALVYVPPPVMMLPEIVAAVLVIAGAFSVKVA